MRYYIDTCIWLNLFKEEKPWNVFAARFLKEKTNLFISSFVVKELERILGERFSSVSNRLDGCKKVDVTQEDLRMARKLESAYAFTISFYDCVHAAIAKRSSFVLVTRDKELLELARSEGIVAGKPERL